MPIYEYRCRDCASHVNLFFRSIGTASEPVCPHCGSRQLEKLMSRVALRRGHQAEHEGSVTDSSESYEGWSDPPASGYDSFDDPGVSDDEADPRELASWTRRMSRQMGEPLEADLDRALSEIERGADPDEALDRLEEAPPPEPGA